MQAYMGKSHKSQPHQNLKPQASEMPHHAKHHASVLACKDAQLGDSNAHNNMSLGEGRSWYRPLHLPHFRDGHRDKKKKWQELLLLPLSGVQDETRTHTNHCSLPPQSSASTNSATWTLL